MSWRFDMIVLVCGGRDYKSYDRVCRALDELNPELVVHGCARGADTLSSSYAIDRGIPEIRFPANWKGEGRKAGYNRNRRMLDFAKPDTVVAFPGGRGTEMMIRLAEERGIHVTKIPEFDDDS